MNLGDLLGGLGQAAPSLLQGYTGGLVKSRQTALQYATQKREEHRRELQDKLRREEFDFRKQHQQNKLNFDQEQARLKPLQHAQARLRQELWNMTQQLSTKPDLQRSLYERGILGDVLSYLERGQRVATDPSITPEDLSRFGAEVPEFFETFRSWGVPGTLPVPGSQQEQGDGGRPVPSLVPNSRIPDVATPSFVPQPQRSALPGRFANNRLDAMAEVLQKVPGLIDLHELSPMIQQSMGTHPVQEQPSPLQSIIGLSPADAYLSRDPLYRPNVEMGMMLGEGMIVPPEYELAPRINALLQAGQLGVEALPPQIETIDQEVTRLQPSAFRLTTKERQDDEARRLRNEATAARIGITKQQLATLEALHGPKLDKILADIALQQERAKSETFKRGQALRKQRHAEGKDTKAQQFRQEKEDRRQQEADRRYQMAVRKEDAAEAKAASKGGGVAKWSSGDQKLWSESNRILHGASRDRYGTETLTYPEAERRRALGEKRRLWMKYEGKEGLAAITDPKGMLQASPVSTSNTGTPKPTGSRPNSSAKPTTKPAPAPAAKPKRPEDMTDAERAARLKELREKAGK